MIIQNINNVNSEDIVHIMGKKSINNANYKQQLNDGDDKNSGSMWSFENYTILI